MIFLSVPFFRSIPVVVVIATFCAGSTFAQSARPAAAPGWKVEKTRGLPLPSPATFNSVAVGEVDSVSGPEVVVSTAAGDLLVYSGNGALLWSTQLPNARCATAVGNNISLSSPAIGDLFGNGKHYVVVGYGGIGGKNCGGGVAAYDGRNGNLKWKLDLNKFSKNAGFGTLSNSVFSTPGLFDVDGDGKLEIGFGGFDRNVYLLNPNGQVRWYYNAADTVWSSPAFVDVDRDGSVEMIIGTDISANSKLQPPTEDGGMLYAFRGGSAGKSPVHYSFRDGAAYIWQQSFDQAMFASPVIADVLPSNRGAEIVTLSGCYFPQNSVNKRGAWLKILKLTDGETLKTMPLPHCSWSQAAVGDLDGDGQSELVVTISGAQEIGGDGTGTLMALNPVSGATLWSTELPNSPYAGHLASPVLADLNGDGTLEVVAISGNNLCVYRGSTGEELNCTALYGTGYGTPAVADITGDGKPEVVFAAKRVYAQSWYNKGVIPSEPGTYPPYFSPWPMHRGGPTRAGVVVPSP